MIPKIIHYCWLSSDKYPELIEKCIASWKAKLPDYEFIHWDTTRFKLEDSKWVKQAFEAKKYAFAADYIRFYAVYNFGGIYLDTDVEVLKKFDNLLGLPYFIGSEGRSFLEAGIFGAEKGVEWLGKCLDYYEGKSFVKEDGSYDILTLPIIMARQIGQIREIVELNNIDLSSLKYDESDKLYMFPSDYFCAKNPASGEITLSDNSYSVHHFAGSWTTTPSREIKVKQYIYKLISNIFGGKIFDSIYNKYKNN
jgi:hypothetical protein